MRGPNGGGVSDVRTDVENSPTPLDGAERDAECAAFLQRSLGCHCVLLDYATLRMYSSGYGPFSVWWKTRTLCSNLRPVAVSVIAPFI